MLGKLPKDLLRTSGTLRPSFPTIYKQTAGGALSFMSAMISLWCFATWSVTVLGICCC